MGIRSILMTEEIEYEFVSKIINDYKQNVMNYEIKILWIIELKKLPNYCNNIHWTCTFRDKNN